MSRDVDIQAGLSQLFQLGLELATRIQQDAMEAETPDDRAKLATAFHRISRSVRQTAALKLRLERDAKRALREDAEGARTDHQRAVQRRQGQIKARVQELIWTEHEGERAETLEFTLDELLEADALEDDFLDLPIEAQVARLAEDFHLPNPPAEGQVSTNPTEGGEAHPPSSRPASPPPQSRSLSSGRLSGGPGGDSSPWRGASVDHPFSSG